MHYYSHNIKSFDCATRHLTRVERSLYRDLIELYYDQEKPLKGDFEWLARRVIAKTKTEKKALQYVLGEYFVFENGVWVNERCEKELAAYRSLKEAKSRAGKASGKARKSSAKVFDEKPLNTLSTDEKQKLNKEEAAVEQVLNGCATNQEPITSNQEPITSIKKNKTKKNPPKKNGLDYSGWPDTPSEQVFADWLEMRKRKKANVTQTVVDSFGKELAIAACHGFTVDQCLTECVTSNWQGFKAEWLVGRVEPTIQKTTSRFVGDLKPKKTRDISLAEELLDRSWALGNTIEAEVSSCPEPKGRSP